jgi:hypothetical protein
VQIKTPNPDGSKVNASYIGDSLSGNRYMKCYDSLASQIPEPRTPMHVRLIPATSPPLSAISGITGSRFQRSQYFVLENPECRTPIPRDLVPPVPLEINGSDYFGKSLIAISTSMKLSPRQTRRPNPDGFGPSLLRLRD